MLFRTILITHNSDYCIIQESVYFLPVDGGNVARWRGNNRLLEY